MLACGALGEEDVGLDAQVDRLHTTHNIYSESSLELMTCITLYNMGVLSTYISKGQKGVLY